MPMGRPQASWLLQVKYYLKHTGMAGLASAWAIGQTEVEGVPSPGGRGDALVLRMSPYLI